MTKSTEFEQFSCAKCFTPVAFKGPPQKKMKSKKESDKGQARVALAKKFKSQYYVEQKEIVEDNVLLNQQQIIKTESDSDISAQQQAEYFAMFYFKGQCKHCKNEVAVYDPESKIYFLTSVVPNLIG